MVFLSLSVPLGIMLKDSKDFGILLIIWMNKHKTFTKECKKKFQYQVWLASINNEEPITFGFVLDKIKHSRETNALYVSVTLTHHITTQSTCYQEHRTFFNQFWLISLSSSSNLFPLSLCSAFSVQLSNKLSTTRTWANVKDDPNKEFWYNTMMEHYIENHRVGLCSIPISHTLLPKDTTVFPAVLTFKSKTTNVPHIWELYFCL